MPLLLQDNANALIGNFLTSTQQRKSSRTTSRNDTQLKEEGHVNREKGSALVSDSPAKKQDKLAHLVHDKEITIADSRNFLPSAAQLAAVYLTTHPDRTETIDWIV